MIGMNGINKITGLFYFYCAVVVKYFFTQKISA